MDQITTLTIDLDSILRRRKPEKRLSQLSVRLASELTDWTSLSEATPAPLLLDTNVYVNRAAGRLSAPLRDVVDQGLLFHCSVTLCELATGVANADPAMASWPALRDHYATLFASIPSSRILTPDAQIWTDAGLVAGTLARTQNLQRHQRKECLNDALILLTAAKAGLSVLTENRAEFDLIQQLAPDVRFIYYTRRTT